MSFFEKLIFWLEKYQTPCPFKEHMGFDCFGCGAQRALISLLEGELFESISMYPGLIPLFILFVFFVLQIIFKTKKLYFILKIWFIFTTFIIIISYIIKLISY